MQFICDPCKIGADVNGKEGLALIAKRNMHDKCKGSTWCDCQHRVIRKNIV